jgi:hypothetical protein
VKNAPKKVMQKNNRFLAWKNGQVSYEFGHFEITLLGAFLQRCKFTFLNL